MASEWLAEGNFERLAVAARARAGCSCFEAGAEEVEALAGIAAVLADSLLTAAEYKHTAAAARYNLGIA